MLDRRRLAVLSGLTVLLRAPSFFRPFMDIDEGSYAAIACRMLQGGLPYRDGVENKFPGIFYVYEGIFRLFGRYDMAAVHAVVAAVSLATALVCGAIARRLATAAADGGARAGFLAALGYVVFSTVYYPKMLAGNTEMFVVLPCALAVLASLEARRRPWLYLVAGALAGVATLLKQVAGAILGALCAERFFGALLGPAERRGRAAARALVDCVVVVAGFAAVAAATVLALRRAGLLDDAIFWTWTYVFRHYIPSGNRDHSFAFNFVTNFVPFLLTVSPLVLLGARVRAPAVWWWLASMAGAALVGGRMYGHYFLMMVPPLAVLGGVGADAWLAGPEAARRGRRLAAVCAVLAGGFLVYACVFEAATESLFTPKPDYRRVGEWVRARTTPDERIFVWGWFPPLYQAADRCPSTRFVYTHVLSGSASAGAEARGHTVPEGWDMLMRDLEAAPPPFVLDTSHGEYSYQYAPLESFPRLWSFVDARYQLAGEIEGVRLYRRR